jgi:hypothetical protein
MVIATIDCSLANQYRQISGFATPDRTRSGELKPHLDELCDLVRGCTQRLLAMIV